MKACVVFLMRSVAGVHSVSTLDHDAMMMYLSPTEASLIRRQIRIQIATLHAYITSVAFSPLDMRHPVQYFLCSITRI